MSKPHLIIRSLFYDTKGNLVLFQRPNAPLITWVVLFVFNTIVSRTDVDDSLLHRTTELVAFGALFTWAWLELFQGNSYIRRALGLVVLIVIIKSRV